MSDTIFSLRSWPRAILHIDGDAFFTSCEEAIHPELKGKPIITGGERGIVACASYAAKRLGIRRGVPLHEAKRLCPALVVLPSDYEAYSLFSRRMFNIMRRFTPQVEEYSIDEAFADLTGMRRALRASYETITLKIQQEIGRELGVTVSAGLSITKVLAKVASKHRKPAGFTVIPGRAIASYLEGLPVEKVWGIGPATTSYLRKMGVKTALEFARLPEKTIRARFTKPGEETWRELRGESVYPVSPEEKSAYASISKTKTFAPPTADRDYLFAHLLRNLESACFQARRYNLAPRRIAVFLKKQTFGTGGAGGKTQPPLGPSPGTLQSPSRLFQRHVPVLRPLPRNRRHPDGPRPGCADPVFPLRRPPPGGEDPGALRGRRRPLREIRQAHPPPRRLTPPRGPGQRPPGDTDGPGADAALRRDPPQTPRPSPLPGGGQLNQVTIRFSLLTKVISAFPSLCH
jgi:nucleotidyltransferase/DNA polymerase involved in DNA repair